jgi:hypothetical protein
VLLVPRLPIRRLTGLRAVEGKLVPGENNKRHAVLVLRGKAVAAQPGLGGGRALVLLRRRVCERREVSSKNAQAP